MSLEQIVTVQFTNVFVMKNSLIRYNSLLTKKVFLYGRKMPFK